MRRLYAKRAGHSIHIAIVKERTNLKFGKIDARPGGPVVKSQPSPEGLGDQFEDDLSAVGAALNLGSPHMCH
jgi:hypothetical protein